MPEDRAEAAASAVTLVYLIKQVESAVRSQMDGVVNAAGLTLPQYTALTVLERRPGITAAELARNSFVRAQSMAQLVTGLEEQHLIHRDRDPNNRRQVLISLTSEGQKVLDGVREPVAGVEDKMISVLSHQDIEGLRHSLHACRVALTGTGPR